MKKITFLLTILVLISMSLSAQVVEKAKSQATRSTTKEVAKKVDQGIKSLFNKKKKKQKAETQKQETPAENTASTNTSTNSNQNEEHTSDKTKTNTPATVTRKKSDFIPGEDVIFEDPLKRELMGEFPSKWDLDRGTVENMKFEDANVIGFTAGQSEIFPLMDEEHYLPERFTIEFDCYFYNYGNEGYYLNFDNGAGSYRINVWGLSTRGGNMRTQVENPIGWRHVELSFNKRAMKIYYEGERLVNIPNIKNKPTKVTFGALSPGRSKGQYAMLKNVRIAEGGVPLYNRLLTDGKIVTNDILFDYNKATLQSQSLAIIDDIATMLLEHEDIHLSIEGHTDSDGSESYNLELSEKRAAAVKRVLVEKGIGANRLTTMGFGESVPLEDNATKEGKARNRRVEFVLKD